MRDRLIELLNTCQDRGQRWNYFESGQSVESVTNEILADHLLANGVIVPPYKVGSPIYRIIGENTLNPKIAKWDIVSLIIYPDEIGYVDDTDNWIPLKDFGKTVFLTREEAERALKGEKV